MEPEKRKQTAPYLAFRTFTNALDQLASHGMPNRIDRTVFPSLNGMSRGQVLSAFKFLDLIDDEGIPAKRLETLVLEKDNRKANMRKLIEDKYSDIVALDLSKMPPSQLDAKLSGDAYGVSGETKQKAKTFLLKAAEFSGMQISPLLLRRARSVGGGKRKKVTGTRAAINGQESGIAETEKQTASEPNPPSDMTRTVQLKKGGSLTLSLAINILELTGTDREFVFKIIDQLEEYEKGEAPAPQ